MITKTGRRTTVQVRLGHASGIALFTATERTVAILISV